MGCFVASSGHVKLVYDDALTVAEKDLAVTHPIHVSFAFKHSVFGYEEPSQQLAPLGVANAPWKTKILGTVTNSEEVCKMVRTVFENAIPELGTMLTTTGMGR